jgi:alpha-glucosidase
MAFEKIIYVLRAIGIQGILRTIQYGLSRDRIESRFAKNSAQIIYTSPGQLIQINQIDKTVRLEYENARAELLFLDQNVMRVSWEPGRQPIPYTISNYAWPTVRPEVQIGSSQTIISTDMLKLVLDSNGNFIYCNHDGDIIRKDDPPLRVGDQWSLTTSLSSEEQVYGLGERASSFNLRPGSYRSWNTDIGGSYSRGWDPLYNGTPVYLCLSNISSYLTYYENSFRSTFQIKERLQATFSGGMLRYYLFFGQLEPIYKQFADLTGYPYMPPRWALGYHQSRWSYGSDAEVRSVIKGFDEHQLPISAIHLDIDYMDGFRVFTNNHKRFPDIKQLTRDLSQKGVRVVISINPAVKRDPGYLLYRDGLSKKAYCKLPDGKILGGVSWPGWCVFPDFTDPAARSWWAGNYKSIIDEGIAGIWHDMNEPASFAAWGDKTLPLPTIHAMEGQVGDHLEAHNIYGLLMNQAGYSGLQTANPGKRPWILSRAGWASAQRFAWIWTGDIDSTWEALQQTIPTILGLSLSGHAFSGVDIGGFSGNPSAELYLRWFQLATFLPFFRTHSATGTHVREPWSFEEPTTSIIRSFLHLRYKLMPYLYTTSWQAVQSGIPLVRPVYWYNREEKSLWNVQDEFLLGDALLVAPILHPGETTRQVIFPPGEWCSIWDGQCYSGPCSVDVPVSEEIIPLFIRGGQILTMEEEGQLTLHIFPTNKHQTKSQIYSDSGDGYGAWRVDTFDQNPVTDELSIIWTNTGEYPFPYPNIRLQCHGKKLYKVSADENNYPIQDNSVILPIFHTAALTFENL